VLGDFNEGTSGAAVRPIPRGKRVSKCPPLYHPGQPTWRYKATIGAQFTQTLDHLLFDSSFESLNAWVVNAGSSDHLPVVAHFREAGVCDAATAGPLSPFHRQRRAEMVAKLVRLKIRPTRWVLSRRNAFSGDVQAQPHGQTDRRVR
jgi:hypothetical protein